MRDIVPHSEKLTVKRFALPYVFLYRGESNLDDLGIPRGGDRWRKFEDARRDWLAAWNWAVWSIRLAVLLLFVRASMNCQLHESVLLGIVLVFFFTNPVRYYYAQLVALVLLLAPLLHRGGAVWLLAGLFGLMIVMYAIYESGGSYHIQQFVMSLGLCLELLALVTWLAFCREAPAASPDETLVAAKPARA